MTISATTRRRLRRLARRAIEARTATKRQFERALARQVGATLDLNNMDSALMVDTPKGKVWRDNGCHCMVEPHCNESESFRPAAYGAMIERMSTGMEPCPDPDCDVCEEK